MFWLNVTNIALGVATLVFVVAVAVAVVQAVRRRLRRRRGLKEEVGHSVFVSDVGITMADGGKRRRKDGDSEEDA